MFPDRRGLGVEQWRGRVSHLASGRPGQADLGKRGGAHQRLTPSTSSRVSARDKRRMPISRSATVRHRVALLGNIAMKTGKKLHWDAKSETFTNSPDANAMLTRRLRKPWDLINL